MNPTGLAPERLAGVGDVLGSRYRLDALLATGGMGRVFAGRDLLLDRDVAVKLPSAASDAARERFRREARAAARLNHPNIVSVFDWGESPVPFLVMELVQGRTLRDVLRDEERLPPHEVVAIGVQIADALAHAHAHGVVHRDVKPGNVLVTAVRGSADPVGAPFVKVTDFGISKDAGIDADAVTDPGNVVGTPGYVSPEQAAGAPCDPRTDVYALGVVLGELLTGTRDVTLDGAARPTALGRVLARARAHDPSGRPRDAAALRDELRAVADLLDVPLTAVPEPAPAPRPAYTPSRAPGARSRRGRWRSIRRQPSRRPTRARRWKPRHVVALVAAPLVAVAAGAGGVYWLTRPPSVAVPTVVQRDLFTATQALQESGFEVQGVVKPNPSPGGTVIRQSPRGGRMLDQGSTVTITISDVAAKVPDVVGRDVETALGALGRAGFVDVQLVDDFRDDIAPGTVVRTSPGTFAQAKKAAALLVTVARDPYVSVPNVVGLEETAARATLEERGLVAAVKTGTSRTVAAGGVIAVSPPVDRVVRRGTTVTLTVSTGPRLAVVPYVVGSSSSKAMAELSARGFAVAVATTKASGRDVGRVVAQDPAGGQAHEGSTVTITVGQK